MFKTFRIIITLYNGKRDVWEEDSLHDALAHVDKMRDVFSEDDIKRILIKTREY